MSILLFYSCGAEGAACTGAKKEEKLLAGLLPYGWFPVQDDK